MSICFVEWKPYDYTTDGHADGISVEILGQAARRAGYEPSFTELPWKRCLSEVADGKFDVAMDGSPRDEYFVGEQSYVHSYYVYFVTNDSPEKTYSGPSQFNGKKVSLVRGWWYPDVATKAPGLIFDELTNEPAQLQSLTLQRHDAAFGDLVTLGSIARERDIKVRPLAPAAEIVKFKNLYNKGKADMGKAVDQALKAMLDEGAVDEVYKKRVGVTFKDLGATAAGTAKAATP